VIKIKGYSSLQQFTEDHTLYKTAKNIDPGRDDGKTLTNFIKKRMDTKFKNSTKQFKNMLKKSGYTKNDLILISVHDSMSRIYEFEDFISSCYNNKEIETAYDKILTSKAFRSGRLRKLYCFIPTKINTKQEFYMFVRRRRMISKIELKKIMNSISCKRWLIWLQELIDAKKIEDNGRVILI